MRRRVLILFVAVFTIAAVSSLQAQTSTTGELGGTVTDPSNAVVPNALVTLKNLATGAITNTRTNGAGLYKFAYLQPGNYSVSVSTAGFQAIEKKIVIVLGSSTSSNFKLELSGTTTTLEVTGAAAQI